MGHGSRPLPSDICPVDFNKSYMEISADSHKRLIVTCQQISAFFIHKPVSSVNLMV